LRNFNPSSGIDGDRGVASTRARWSCHGRLLFGEIRASNQDFGATDASHVGGCSAHAREITGCGRWRIAPVGGGIS
jgi:hypothetical protein